MLVELANINTVSNHTRSNWTPRPTTDQRAQCLYVKMWLAAQGLPTNKKKDAEEPGQVAESFGQEVACEECLKLPLRYNAGSPLAGALLQGVHCQAHSSLVYSTTLLLAE
jgi:hypothetical protein